MAYIREYAAMSGDPFRFRGLFRGLKKLGRGAFRVVKPFAGTALGFVPGGGLISRAARLGGQVLGDPYDELEWARGTGYLQGDPGRAPKRKQAGAGPKAKAGRKRAARRDRRGGVGSALSHFAQGAARHAGALGRIGGAVISNLPIAGPALGQIGKELGLGGEDTGDLQAVAAGMGTLPTGAGPVPGLPPIMHGGKMKHPRYTKRGTITYRAKPHMHATNTRALRRSANRLGAFNKIADRVRKELSHLAPRHHSSSRSGGGHRPGCRCVTCRRK